MIRPDDGKVVRTIGRQGSGPGEFKNPLAVAVDGDGNVLVADTGHNRYPNKQPMSNWLCTLSVLSESCMLRQCPGSVRDAVY